MRSALLAFTFAWAAAGAPSVGVPAASPSAIPLNQATVVTVTSLIASPSPLATGVNLLQVNATGGAAQILGVMHDDGKNGDAAAGDGIFTVQVTFTQAAATTLYLQVSAAFPGVLQRVLSGIVPLNAVAAPSITGLSPSSGPAGTLVTATGANFVPSAGATPSVALAKAGGSGTVAAPVVSANNGSVSFVIPANAATGPVTISAGGQSGTSATALTVTGGAVFSVAAMPAAVNVIQGQSAGIAVQMTSSSGFTGLASLSVSGVPAGMSASFNPPNLSAGQTSVLTLGAPAGQALGTTTITITASATVDGVALTQSGTAGVTVQAPTTSLIGRTVASDALETPLAGVTVTMLGKDGNGNVTSCTGSAVSDAAGNFALKSLPAMCVGPQLVGYNGLTVTSPPGQYAGVNLVYTLAAGQVTQTPVLIHLPRIDNQETFMVQQNSATDQSYAFKTIPNLSVTVYAGTVFTMPDGTQPNPFPLTAINVPVDRLPDIKPPVPTMIIAFIVAFQPANAFTNQPVAVYYPNTIDNLPGTSVSLLTLDPTHGSMVPYGTGTVSNDGTEIIPDLDPSHPGHRYGLVHFDWHTDGSSPANQTNPCDHGCSPVAGHPVDFSSGLQVIKETDVSFGSARGSVALIRTYRNKINPAATTYGPFGYGTNHNYGYELVGVTPSAASVIPLILPDGNQVPFAKQADGTYVNVTGVAMAAGAVLRVTSASTLDLRWKDGTTYHFLQIIVVPFYRNLLASITDPNGNTTQFQYSGFQLTTITDPVGRQLLFSYNSYGYVAQVTAPDGTTVSYSYTGPEGIYLHQVTHQDGTTTLYDYDSLGNVVKETDGRGVVVATTVYDANSRVIEQTQADGGVLQFAYTLQNPTAPATSPVMSTTFTDAMKNQAVYRFSPVGALLGVTDSLGQARVFALDGNNNVVGLNGGGSCGVCQNRGQGDQTFIVDASANVLSQTDSLGHAMSYTYDPTFNKVTSATDALGDVTHYDYDSRGNLVKRRDPNGNATTFTYDSFGEVTQSTDPTGAKTLYGYDSFGNLTTVTDAVGNATTTAYDVMSRPIASIDALGRRTQTTYDAMGRIASQTNAQNNKTAFAYDGVGNLLSVTDARNNKTAFTYDGMNRLVTRMTASGTSDSRAYDLNGNLISFTDRRGQKATFSYDTLNRLTAENYVDATVKRSYDANSRLFQVNDSAAGLFVYTYDAAGRMLSASGPTGTVLYAYDAANRVASRQVGGQPVLAYSYDAASNLASVSMPGAGATFTYDSRNLPASVSRANGVSSAYSYDPLARPLSLTHAKGSAPIDSETYAYDAVGNRTNHSTAFAQALITPAVASATYDANNEQTQFGSTSNTFDANGNLATSTNSAGTTTYSWDGRNRLASIVTSAGQTTKFTYDYTGEMLVQADSGSSLNLTKSFVLDDLTNVAYEVSSDGSSYSVLSGRSIDSHMAIAQPSGQTLYGLADALGSTMVAVDQAGTTLAKFFYEPYGQVAASGSYPFEFTGRTVVSGTLNYYRARFYNTQTGRFISEDPVGFGGGVNFYSYVGNNPIAFSDPLGLKVSICCRSVDVNPVANCVANAFGLQHCFIQTDSIEAGMGPANNGPLPSCPIGVPTAITLHTGQAASSNCQEVPNVNESCVNSMLVPGQSTGRWTPWNNCNTFANGVIDQCRNGSSAPSSCNPNFQSCPFQ